ncbi:glycosyltransferase [Youngiibacter multivorans]|uniref:GT2 family glycosyltransferase n=1 Tax=Youngiibacter multivorans TaxID=937251 RepID=A0ABS4G6B0_9CLOT|nr:glycosyltransferase [Youngiibacter multivorans]MBP1920100.1 GT2 family glycosyltransferase [Youngiibacter multivorans]
MSVAAVIVTYNRSDLLMANLDMLNYQTRKFDSIIIIDNASTDGTEEKLREKQYFKNLPIDYILLNSNTGGAGGFSYGVKYAYDMGFDWIVLMDDDGKPANSMTIEKLVNRGEYLYISKNRCVMINSLVTYDGENLSFTIPYTMNEIKVAQKTGQLLEGAISPFNCTLISKEVVTCVGAPRADFFIACDEREYIARNQRNGTYIATVSDSIYLHPQSRDGLIKDKCNFYETFENTNKEYYYTRNTICMEKNLRSALRVLTNRIITISKFEDKKFERLCICTKATVDALLGRMGKRM